jgi:PIN domain nuclease of toxin-antitoxin system
MILLDTQVVIWMMTDKRNLSRDAAECIRIASRDAEGVCIASSTVWEIAMASRNGRIRPPVSLTEFLAGLARAFIVLPIIAAIAERSVDFSDRYPRDPTDRMIGATALVHGARLVTKDKQIRASGEVNCVW